MSMTISIVTACFNCASTLQTALASVAAQKGVSIDYIVVDGASTDGTVEMLKAFQENLAASSRDDLSFRFISERDEGMYDAINKGIGMARGEFVGILNADDYLDGDDVIARVASYLRNQEQASLDCVFGNVRFVREFGGKTHRVCFARFWRPWMLHWGYMPPHPAIFIRRTRFADWGGYVPSRTEYRIAADNELLIRFFCRNRMSHRYIPVCTTVMRTGGVSTRGIDARWRLNAEIIKGNRANGYFCCWPMLLPKYLIKIWEVILPRLGLMK